MAEYTCLESMFRHPGILGVCSRKDLCHDPNHPGDDSNEIPPGSRIRIPQKRKAPWVRSSGCSNLGFPSLCLS